MQTLIERADEPAGLASPADPAGRPAAGPAAVGGDRRVLRGSALILLTRGVAIWPAMVLSIGLARTLGAAGFGTYQTALAWLAVLAVPAGLGVEKLLVERIAAHGARAEWAAIRGLLQVSVAVVACSALAIAALAGSVGALLPALTGFDGLPIVLATLPLMVMLRIVQATLQGFDHVVGAQLPELLVVPLVSAAGLGIAVVWGGGLSVEGALWLVLASYAVALAVAAASACRRLPWRLIRSQPAVHDVRGWRRTAVPLLCIAGLLVVNSRADVVMLGALAGAAEVGAYGAAQRCAGLIPIVLVSANAALAPAIARLHAAGEHRELQRILTKTVRFVTLLGGIGAATFVVAGELALSLFGPDFAHARGALTVLSLAQLVNVSMSAPGLVLMMTGQSRIAAIGLGGGAAVNVLFNWILIPPLGATGAALATAAGVLSWTTALAWVVRRRTGLDTTIFARMPR